MGGVVTSREVSISLVKYAEGRIADPRIVWGLPWGFGGLNTLTGGIHAGQMTVLQARPSVGKTLFLQQTAASVADFLMSVDGRERHPDQVIRLVLCEMTAEQFQMRLICQRAKITSSRVDSGRLSERGLERFKAAARDVAKMPIEYLDTPTSLDDTAEFVRRGPRDGKGRKCAWFAVDYLQIHPLGGRQGNDGGVAAVTLASATFRDLAKLTAPGMVLSQMSRAVDSRAPEDRRPQMSDLRGSGAIEQDASLVLGLYREDLYQRIPDEERGEARPAELIVNKSRYRDISGRTVHMTFLPRRGMFEDVSALFVDEGDEGED